MFSIKLYKQENIQGAQELLYFAGKSLPIEISRSVGLFSSSIKSHKLSHICISIGRFLIKYADHAISHFADPPIHLSNICRQNGGRVTQEIYIARDCLKSGLPADKTKKVSSLQIFVI